MRKQAHDATAKRVRTTLALVVAMLAGIVWWTSRGDWPAAKPEVNGAAISSPIVRSGARDSTPEPALELATRTRTVAPVRVEPASEGLEASPPIDSTCATIEVRVSVGKRVEEVSDFTCRFLRLSDSARFGAQAVGAQLSYCLPLAKAHDEAIVSVSDERLGTASARARVSYGSRVQLHLRLPGNGKVRGFVLDEKRAPIADAWVFSGTLHRMRDEDSADLFEPLEIDRVDGAVITDANGAFELFAGDGCVTAWHDEHTSATVSTDDATCIVMRARGELRLQVLDDAAQPWARGSITLDGARADTTDLLGRVFFKDVELGVRGLTLLDGRTVGLLFSAPSAVDVQVGPWLTAVELRDAPTLRELRRTNGGGMLVGLDGVFSIVPIRTSGRELVIDAILPGTYLLVTKLGWFASVFVEPDGSIHVPPSDARRRTLRVEAPSGVRAYIVPERAHALVERACLLVNGQAPRANELLSWPSIPTGRWLVKVEGACDGVLVDVKEHGQTVALR